MIYDTIIAQCTPSGLGALALLRVSGVDACQIVSQCTRLSSGQKISDVATHSIQHGFVVTCDGGVIDEVLFFVMHAPRTFTGENTIEITTHNNPFIIQAVIDRIVACGARLAFNGEFSQQAVMNGKMDIIQAESINELIHANSEHQLKQSLSQLSGSFSAWVLALENDLLHLMALCEASFEFLEEDVDFSFSMRESLLVIMKKINDAKKTFDIQQQLRNGIRIALIGSVNTGKSSLFNVLLGKQRAIVTPIAGTTRDVIEAGLYKNGIYWTLIDTAGLRVTDDVVEQYGIDRSYTEAGSADIILLVWDGTRAMTDAEYKVYETLIAHYEKKIILVINKADQSIIPNSLFKVALLVSTVTQLSVSELENQIETLIERQIIKDTCPFLLNKRHFSLLTSCEQQLSIVHELLERSVRDYEIIAIHLKDALAILTELTGHSVTEKAMDKIFKEFCIGK